MKDHTDSLLLLAYAEHGSEAAFRELVCRYVDFVHSAALRMVSDAHLAQDVSQSVFVALAKNAASLAKHPVLAGWLHRTTQNIAAQTVRTDVRRRRREQEAVAMNELLSATPEAPWKEIAPHLDAALSDLSEPDRDAVLLRYFQKQSAQEMAAHLGISHEAAQKRVARAVERLRELFAKRGIAVGTSGLALLITTNAVQAAPVALAVTISTASALTGTALAGSTTTTLVMTTIQKIIIGSVLTVAIGAAVYQTREISRAEARAQSAEKAPPVVLAQLHQLAEERDEAARTLAALRDENHRLKQNATELPRLRGEVGMLRRTVAERSNSIVAAPKLADRAESASEERHTIRRWLNGTNQSGWTTGTNEFLSARLHSGGGVTSPKPTFNATAELILSTSPTDRDPVIQGNPTPGGMLVKSGVRWYPVEILESKNGQHLIHYIGYDASWDEWVNENRLARYEGAEQ